LAARGQVVAGFQLQAALAYCLGNVLGGLARPQERARHERTKANAAAQQPGSNGAGLLVTFGSQGAKSVLGDPVLSQRRRVRMPDQVELHNVLPAVALSWCLHSNVSMRETPISPIIK